MGFILNIEIKEDNKSTLTFTTVGTEKEIYLMEQAILNRELVVAVTENDPIKTALAQEMLRESKKRQDEA